MNNLFLNGRLTNDIEINEKEFNRGKDVLQWANFTIAFDMGADNDAQFFDVTAFGKSAEFLSKYGRKGARIGICGHLKQDKFVDKDTGKNRSKLSIICDRVEFLDWPQDEQEKDERPKSKGNNKRYGR